MKITFISVGVVKKRSLREGAEDYIKRIGRHMDASLKEIRVPAFSPKAPVEDALRKEAALALKGVSRGDFLVALSERGREFSTAEFTGLMRDAMGGSGRLSGKKGLSFMVGGAYGFHGSVLDRADLVMSLSRMTFPHEIALLLMAEQVYRAFTIIKGEPYHK